MEDGTEDVSAAASCYPINFANIRARATVLAAGAGLFFLFVFGGGILVCPIFLSLGDVSMYTELLSQQITIAPQKLAPNICYRS